jgi:hypothetical protein
MVSLALKIAGISVSIVIFDDGTICPILILPNPSEGGALCCDVFIFI